MWRGNPRLPQGIETSNVGPEAGVRREWARAGSVRYAWARVHDVVACDGDAVLLGCLLGRAVWLSPSRQWRRGADVQVELQGAKEEEKQERNEGAD